MPFLLPQAGPPLRPVAVVEAAEGAAARRGGMARRLLARLVPVGDELRLQRLRMLEELLRLEVEQRRRRLVAGEAQA